ncbi:uncharacterized protein BJX67DRAFT_368037 [Aspergillus lucknowensis]|uniref:Uncharacterized protein n=1 Tax=Aspergillus lucknowensis TaxID=176173 RepID=A0ABR4L8M2_9EURO
MCGEPRGNPSKTRPRPGLVGRCSEMEDGESSLPRSRAGSWTSNGGIALKSDMRITLLLFQVLVLVLCPVQQGGSLVLESPFLDLHRWLRGAVLVSLDSRGPSKQEQGVEN